MKIIEGAWQAENGLPSTFFGFSFVNDHYSLNQERLANRLTAKVRLLDQLT